MCGSRTLGTNEQKAEGSQEVSYLYGSAEAGPHALGLNYSGVLYFVRGRGKGGRRFRRAQRASPTRTRSEYQPHSRQIHKQCQRRLFITSTLRWLVGQPLGVGYKHRSYLSQQHGTLLCPVRMEHSLNKYVKINTELVCLALNCNTFQFEWSTPSRLH